MGLRGFVRIQDSVWLRKLGASEFREFRVYGVILLKGVLL